jgi:hypothetical protein
MADVSTRSEEPSAPVSPESLPRPVTRVPPPAERRQLRPFLVVTIMLAVVLTLVGIVRSSLMLGGVGVSVIIAVCVIGGYLDHWDWTGLGTYHYTKGPDEEFERGKTLWDLLQLLIIPAVLSTGAIWYGTQQQTAADREKAQEQTQQALKVQRAQATAQESQALDGVLNAYVDYITGLLLHDGLGDRHPRLATVVAAEARTITALRRLDSPRNATLTHFLSDAHLLRSISLAQTDLSGVHLEGAYLEAARLQGADLTNADLSGASLQGANLSDTTLDHTNLQDSLLSSARLCRAQVIGANLRRAHLESALLKGAVLDGDTDLRGAILENANTRGTQWIKVRFGPGTECPDYSLMGSRFRSARSCPTYADAPPGQC